MKLTSKNPFHKLFIPERVIADFKYPFFHQNKKKQDVKFIFCTNYNTKKYILLVLAMPSISPMQYAWETHGIIKEFLDSYNLCVNDVDIILDYSIRNGLNNGDPMLWKFQINQKGQYENDYFTGLTNDLEAIVKDIKFKYFMNGSLPHFRNAEHSTLERNDNNGEKGRS